MTMLKLHTMMRNRLISSLLLWLMAASTVLHAAPVLQIVYAAPSGAAFNGLTLAPDGNFYGTVSGTNFGTGGFLFQVTPAGVYTTIASFNGPNGADPRGPLLLASDGILYGTTFGGGAYGHGTLFKLLLQQGAVPQTIYSFNGGNGVYPMYNLIQGSDGYLYGVTTDDLSSNFATVFRTTTTGAVTTLTNLSNVPAGTSQTPVDGLVEGPDGALYGVARSVRGVPGIIGSFYRLAKDGTGMRALTNFTNPVPPGSIFRPLAGLTTGNDGFLYGSVGYGSPLDPQTNGGWLFRMSTNGAMTTLYTFEGANGSNVTSRLLSATDGNFYGRTTGAGGAFGRGTLFQMTPNGSVTTLINFAATNGLLSYSLTPQLVQGADGNLYGVTRGSSGGNTFPLVFRCVEPPIIRNFCALNGYVQFVWNSFSNGRYSIFYKDSLDQSAWSALGSIITATGESTSFADHAGAAAQRFYQVMLLP